MLEDENEKSVFTDWINYAHKYINPDTVTGGNFELLQNEQFIALMEHAPSVVLIVNHASSRYEFFSKNMKHLSGYTSEEMIAGGVQFGVTIMDPEHTGVMSECVFPAMFENLGHYAKLGELKKIRLSYNFRIRRKDGSTVWVLQQMNILETDENGGPLLSMYFMTDISNHKKDDLLDFTVSKLDDSDYFNTVYTTSFPTNSDKIELTTRESQIIRLIHQGSSSNEIASKLSISLHTVNTHRKNIFGKLGATNTANMLSIARVKGLV